MLIIKRKVFVLFPARVYISVAMKFLEQRPLLETFERINMTAPTWVATIADERLCMDDHVRDQLRKAVVREGIAKYPLLKLLMVTSPNGTRAFATWTNGVGHTLAMEP